MCWLDSSGKRSSRCAETHIRLYARAPRCRSLCCSIWLVSSLCCTAVCVFRLWSILHSLPLFTSTSANSSDTNTFTPGDLAFPGLLFLYFIHHHMHSSHTHTHAHTISCSHLSSSTSSQVALPWPHSHRSRLFSLPRASASEALLWEIPPQAQLHS